MTQITAKINNQEYSELPKDLYIDPAYLEIFLQEFEGPLDLLLYLIRKQNIDILTIPITKITDQYLNYINNMQTLNFDLAGEYLLMAAMLLSIKSRMLLPKPPQAIDNESELDPRVELINRLLEYEKIKQAAKSLDALPVAGRNFWWIDTLPNEEIKISPKVTIADLSRALHNLLLKHSKSAPHIIKREELSVREYMTAILRKLTALKHIEFTSLFSETATISHIVVNFIAVLELAKEGLVGLSIASNTSIMINIK
ncbi:MAG: segregation and condensation protein [Pseudomonadota bacterium]|nr:segregation and condensation protein [Pseudomonadota bacterium]